jgi:hypothetical protein
VKVPRSKKVMPTFSMRREVLQRAANLACHLRCNDPVGPNLVLEPTGSADAPFALTGADDRISFRVALERAAIRGEIPTDALVLHAFQMDILLGAVRAEWIDLELAGSKVRVTNGDDLFEMRVARRSTAVGAIRCGAPDAARVPAAGFGDALRSGSIAAARHGPEVGDLGGVRLAVAGERLIVFSASGPSGSEAQAAASGAEFDVTIPKSAVLCLASLAASATPGNELSLATDARGLFAVFGDTSVRVSLLEKPLPPHRALMLPAEGYENLATVGVGELRTALACLIAMRADTIAIDARSGRFQISGSSQHGNVKKILQTSKYRAQKGRVLLRAPQLERWLALFKRDSAIQIGFDTPKHAVRPSVVSFYAPGRTFIATPIL